MNKEQKTMDPSRYPSYTEEDSAASGRRLNEILKVFKKTPSDLGSDTGQAPRDSGRSGPYLCQAGADHVHAFRYASRKYTVKS